MNTPSSAAAGAAVAIAVRESYGRLIAFLSVRTRDIAAAEDALGEALVAALATWSSSCRRSSSVQTTVVRKSKAGGPGGWPAAGALAGGIFDVM